MMKWLILLCFPLFVFAQEEDIHPKAIEYMEKNFPDVGQAGFDQEELGTIVLFFRYEEEGNKFGAVFNNKTGDFIELREAVKFERLPIKAVSYVEDHDYDENVKKMELVTRADDTMVFRIMVETENVIAALLFRKDGRFIEEIIIKDYNAYY